MNQSQQKSEGKLLILTLSNDVHVPFVTRHLQMDHILVDPSKLLMQRELSVTYDGNKVQVMYDGKPLDSISSVWYRRPYIPEREDIPVPDVYKDYAYSSVRRHILNLYSLFTDAFWLSDYWTMQRAESKPRQLELASQLGFEVPKTLFTSDSAAAASFIKATGDVVTKSLGNTLPVIDNKVQYFYTTKIASGSKPNLKNLHLAPAIFQAAIDVDLGLRVTVVGENVFAAAVRNPSYDDHPNITDWRRAYTGGNSRFEAYELPKSLQLKCIQLTKALGLQYGAIDIMLDKTGTYWFLEINPNGQWAFIEDDTGQPIGETIARLLENGNQ